MVATRPFTLDAEYKINHVSGILDKERINKVVEIKARLTNSCLWETLYFSPSQKEVNIGSYPSYGTFHIELNLFSHSAICCLDYEPFRENRDHLTFSHKSTVLGT